MDNVDRENTSAVTVILRTTNAGGMGLGPVLRPKKVS